MPTISNPAGKGVFRSAHVRRRMSALRVFQEINTSGSNAVSWKEWKAFFKDVGLGVQEKMAEMNRVNIEVRAKMQEDRVLKKVKEQTHKVSKSSKKSVPKDTAQDDGPQRQPQTGVAHEAQEPLPAVWQRFYDELSLLQDDEGKEYASLTDEEVGAVRSACQALGLTMCQKVDGGPVTVYNYSTFAKETRKRLRALKEERFLEFPTELTDVQRGIVHGIAEELGLASYDRGQGEEKSAVVANTKGFAERIRTEFAAIELGGSRLYTEAFSPCQRHIVQAVADSLDLWVRPSQGALEVFSLDDFGKGVRRDLMALTDGAEMAFQPALSEQQRKIVFAIAEDLGLVAVDTGSDDCRQIAVGNMTSFLEEVKAKLQPLKRGQMHAFAKSLTPVQSSVVHMAAAQMGLYSETMLEGDDTWVEVHKLYPGQTAPYRQPPPLQMIDAGSHADAQQPPPAVPDVARSVRRRGSAVGGASAAAAEARSQEPPAGSAPAEEARSVQAAVHAGGCGGEDQEESLMQKAFDTFATGNFQGQKIFLRFPDLKELVSKIPGVTSANTFHKYEKELESAFNDTMQLQIDMDLRCSKGLTFRWFQVFIQAAMRKIGKNALAFLFTLGQKREPKA
ncbi:unnamed protein product [Prorocentrum cordatum]|uniref:R3H domain-containing protein n=2 Tax=Prorocentrum cordatum TaxID=2364126 RepID=A0ABN9PRP9_9DINO|nr:unnamed protein product [Polarella glacialis]